MKTNNRLAIVPVMLCLFFMTGCNNEESSLEYKTQGYIKGTFTATSLDKSYVFNERFHYNQYKLGDGSSYSYEPGSGYVFFINRNNYNSGESFRLNFRLAEEALDKPNDMYVNFNFVKEEKNKFISFSIYPIFQSMDKTIIFSEFSFDPGSGRTKGKFTMTNNLNSTQKDATVSCEFDVIARKSIQ